MFTSGYVNTESILHFFNVAREKFGEHERCVRVTCTRGVAENNSSFLSGKFFFSRDLFADVLSAHNGNMKHARAIKFDYTNLLAML